MAAPRRAVAAGLSLAAADGTNPATIADERRAANARHRDQSLLTTHPS